jgi:hypothetical protein
VTHGLVRFLGIRIFSVARHRRLNQLTFYAGTRLVPDWNFVAL